MSSDPAQREHDRDAKSGHRGHEARGGHHPRLGCRPRDGVLRGSRVATGRHAARLRRGPVHAARLRLLGPVRHEPHVRRARIGPEPVPDRLRHPGCPRRAGRARRRGERGLPPRRRTARSAARARSRQLRRRSPRSATPTATAGCCRRSRRGCPAASTRAETTFASAGRPGERDAACRGRPRRAREAHRASATRTGPTGTPRTWSRSRRARSCRM